MPRKMLLMYAMVTLSYGPDPRHRLDLYRTSKPGAPLIVYVHGGAWVSGSKDAYGPLGASLAKANVSTAIVNYRLTSAERPVRYPESPQDVARALDFVFREIAKWQADPKRVYVLGHSAGAHIAASLATDPRFAKSAAGVAGFIGLEGIYDLPALVKRWPSYRDWFVTLAFGAPDAWPSASPTLAKQALRARWLLVHSKDDELVDTAQTTDFAKALENLHVPVRTELPAGLSHAGVVEQLVRGGPLAKTVIEFTSR